MTKNRDGGSFLGDPPFLTIVRPCATRSLVALWLRILRLYMGRAEADDSDVDTGFVWNIFDDTVRRVMH